ncbi:MAG: PKD domain-containing protein, partial [Ferruginibacter sp.]
MKSCIVILTFLCNVINVQAQNADFTYSTLGNLYCAPQTITFTASTAGNPSVYIWDFGDGTSGNGGVENHTYPLPGNYTVSLISVFSTYASYVSKSIVVNVSPTVSIQANV